MENKYKVSVPVMNLNVSEWDREATLRELERLDAERVFLALDCYETSIEKRRLAIAALKENCAFFKSRGYSVGAWIWTFLFNGSHPYTPMRSAEPSPTDVKELACPSDVDFVAFAQGYIRDIASTGVDIIMFDDDFRFVHIGEKNVGCLCPNHVAMINSVTGEELSPESLASRILTGGKNPCRDALIQVNGSLLRSFALKMRQAVDSVDPSVRMGACACFGSWDIDGISARELADCLAGSTKPFVRLIGAPYWAARRNSSWNMRLQDVIELERLESSWTRDGDIEIMAEGDAYPRPRTACPAAFLEGFDIAVRAAGITDGILKYGIDYASSPDYEQGYAVRHVRNRPIYEELPRFFDKKTHVGVRVYEYPQKAAGAVLDGSEQSPKTMEYLFFPISARVTAANTIPTVYEGEGVCGIVFGESARYLPQSAFDKGLIIDGTAAGILTEAGVDVGIRELGGTAHVAQERYLGSGQRTRLFANVNTHTLAENITTLSVDDLTGIPVSYLYENPRGQRFLVINIDLNFSASEEAFRHYARSAEIADAVPFLSGEKLPAYCYGNPDLYIQAKEGEDGSLSVGLWNFCVDDVISPKVKLGKIYTSVSFLNTHGTLSGDTVSLEDIPPYGFSAFEVK